MSVPAHVLEWLLAGDVSIQYSTYRDLLARERKDLQKRIPKEGWGKTFLSKQKMNGHWGDRFYQPKWISTHYTLLDLKMLGLPQNIKDVQSIIRTIISEEKSEDGGINPSQSISASDVCVNGMFLQYACYFKSPAKGLESVIDFLLKEQMPDGGFNCRSNRSGARHSSMHSTVSVMEGLSEYHSQGYSYKLESVRRMIRDCADFLLLHRLFRSDRTGKVIHPDFLKLSYPPRWKYNILRALDAFRHAKIEWHPNMQDAVDVILAKKTVMKPGIPRPGYRARPIRKWKKPANREGGTH